MRDLAGEAFGQVTGQPKTCQGPQLRVDIVLDEEDVRNLRVEAGEEAKLCLCAAVCLCRKRSAQEIALSMEAWRILDSGQIHLAKSRLPAFLVVSSFAGPCIVSARGDPREHIDQERSPGLASSTESLVDRGRLQAAVAESLLVRGYHMESKGRTNTREVAQQPQ
jgi:hypothetical protein